MIFIDISGNTATQAENDELRRLRRRLGDDRYEDIRSRVYRNGRRRGEKDSVLWQEFIVRCRETATLVQPI